MTLPNLHCRISYDLQIYALGGIIRLLVRLFSYQL